jgi:hypothetical protein
MRAVVSVDTTELRRVAIHEASHAVCGRTLGLAIGGASITPDGTGIDGRAIVAGHHTIHNDLIARGEYQDFLSSVCLKIMVSLAGSEAEHIAGFTDADLGGDDRTHVLELCRRYSISDATVDDYVGECMRCSSNTGTMSKPLRKHCWRHRHAC